MDEERNSRILDLRRGSLRGILNLRQRQWIASIDVLAAEMAGLAWEQWLVEDFAENPDDPLCPAADLKFYSFYGRVGIVLEVERYPVTRYARGPGLKALPDRLTALA